MAGHIYRTETPNSVQTVVQLYKALVRPHLEYCSLVWSTYLKKDILNIEKGTMKGYQKVSALNYEERLNRTGLIILEYRRLWVDLLEVVNIMKGFVQVDPATHFSMSDRRSRGHTLKLEEPRARLELRKHYINKGIAILSIEKVQRMVINMIPSISALNYEERLKRPGLITLENRRLRVDLEVFNILKGPVKLKGDCIQFIHHVALRFEH